MRYLAFLSLLLLSFSVNAQDDPLSRTSTIKESVTLYLQSNLNEPSSYQSVGWSKLKTFKDCYTDSLQFNIDKMLNLGTKKEREARNKKVFACNKPVVGYSILHTYRAKNSFGALILVTNCFLVYNTGAIVNFKDIEL